MQENDTLLLYLLRLRMCDFAHKNDSSVIKSFQFTSIKAPKVLPKKKGSVIKVVTREGANLIRLEHDLRSEEIKLKVEDFEVVQMKNETINDPLTPTIVTLER